MSWRPIGPRFVFSPRDTDFLRVSRRNEIGEQGLVARIAIEPGNAQTIYSVVRPDSGGAGLFRSSNAGTPQEDWISIVDQLQQANPQIDPSCVAVNPATPSTIWMGTWDNQSVYTSLDRGDSWAMPVSIGGKVRKLLIDPRTAGNPAATVIFAATDQGVFRSADSGVTWDECPGWGRAESLRFHAQGRDGRLLRRGLPVGSVHDLRPDRNMDEPEQQRHRAAGVRHGNG